MPEGSIAPLQTEASMNEIAMLEIPPNELFRFYISDGNQSRAVLWFKCSANGDLVTKPQAKAPKILRTKGVFTNGRFTATDGIEDLGVSSDDKHAHPHFTFHPSKKGFQTPIVRAPGNQSHLPRFDLKSLIGLHEVVKHILATPEAYPVESPKTRYHAVIQGAYTATRTTELTFFVAPIDLKARSVPDELILPNAVAHVVCTQSAMEHSVLIQVVHSLVDRPDTGNMHLMAIPQS